LLHLTDYAKTYFLSILERYGKDKSSKTELRSFDTILATQVAIANRKLYVNREEGFIGLGLKKDEYVCECSDLDDLIVFLKDGKYLVTKVSDKSFVGKDIVYVDVWKKNDTRKIYNVIYKDGKTGASFIKRFSVKSSTRDKPYDLTIGNPGSSVIYFSANPNGEAETVAVYLSPSCKARRRTFEFDFAELSVKGRGARGNKLSKYPVSRVVQKTTGMSTLGGLEIWYDETVGRLNREERGRLLGSFEGEDLILALKKDGIAHFTSYELINRYEPDQLLYIEKFNPEIVLSVVYYDGEREQHFAKSFQFENYAAGKQFLVISDNKDSALKAFSTDANPVIEIEVLKGRDGDISTEKVNFSDIVGMKGWKALGNRLSKFPVCSVCFIEEDPPEKKIQEDSRNVNDEIETSVSSELEDEDSVEESDHEIIDNDDQMDFFSSE
ncbi:MAG: hypothetical protein P9M03_07990, partial [Candidatus Theseobacter exili]|nr:hypothetical protein [Candidatus Theseobacter exili]